MLFVVKNDGKCRRLTHWGRVTHICVGKLTIIGSDNGLSPGRRQAIIWTNAGILLISPLGTNFDEILTEVYGIKIHSSMCLAANAGTEVSVSFALVKSLQNLFEGLVFDLQMCSTPRYWTKGKRAGLVV